MKDTLGREWIFRFTARTVRELASETKLDTQSLHGENSLLQRVGSDESTLYTVMWVTIRPQALERGVSEDEWFEGLDNDSLQQAAKEWVAAYINFSPPARRKALSRTLEKCQDRMEMASEQVETLIRTGEMDRAIDNALSKHFQNSTTIAASSQESSG